MGIFWEDEAWNEYLGWQEQDIRSRYREFYPGGGVVILMRRTELCTRR